MSLLRLAQKEAVEGECERAVSLYERGLGLAREVLGPLHQTVVDNEMRLADTYKQCGDLERAEEAYRGALPRLREIDSIGGLYAIYLVGYAEDGARPREAGGSSTADRGGARDHGGTSRRGDAQPRLDPIRLRGPPQPHGRARACGRRADSCDREVGEGPIRPIPRWSPPLSRSPWRDRDVSPMRRPPWPSTCPWCSSPRGWRKRIGWRRWNGLSGCTSRRERRERRPATGDRQRSSNERDSSRASC